MLTFSKPKGIVEAGEDDGSVSRVHNAWKYMHLVGFFPWVHRLNAWFINVVVTGWTNKIKSLPVFIVAKNKGAIEMQENVFGVSSNFSATFSWVSRTDKQSTVGNQATETSSRS
jgi:hypothetical protein